MSLQPFRKKDKPGYMAQESRFAKRHGMRQTISSGRVGIMKGDAYDSHFVVDNKQTGAYEYGLDVREWVAFAKRSSIVRRLPVLHIEFLPTIRRRDESTEVTSVVIMDYNDWERMREASGWGIKAGRTDRRAGNSTGTTKRQLHKASAPTKRSRGSR